MHDFEKCPDRTHTDSIKWSAAPEGVLPMWVADMDIPVAEPVQEALRERVAHPCFGYPDFEQKELKNLTIISCTIQRWIRIGSSGYPVLCRE